MRALSLAAAIAFLISVTALGQAPSGGAVGHPNLQGIWTNATLTPLERPVALGTKAFLTESEAAQLDRLPTGRESRTSATGRSSGVRVAFVQMP